MEMLRNETDPDHGLTMSQILERLEAEDITAERKSVYSDIEALKDFGLSIEKFQRQPVEYALVERDFELPELMLLIDAVQSSRFLSEGSSNALVKSIRGLASTSERDALRKQVHVHGRPRTQNQSDFLTVDKLQEVMAAGGKLSFSYFRYDIHKKKVATREGATHVVTPINLTYSDGNYYLVAFSDADQEIRNYRVDRMERIELVDEPAERNEAISAYDPDEVGKCAFGMYHGQRVTVKLKATENVMNVIVDRFGRDVHAIALEDEGKARVTVTVKESPVFFGWLAQLGSEVEIESPEWLRERYVTFLKDIVDSYA